MSARARSTWLMAAGAAAFLWLAPQAMAGPVQADARLDRALDRLVALPDGPPGVVAVVQRGKNRVVHRVGVANTQTGSQLRARQHMRLASGAKAFSGAVALRLVEEGDLRLDQRARSVLPWLPAAWRKVTLRNLLQHTSGIADFSLDPDFQNALRADLKRSFPHESLVLFVVDQPLAFRPGSTYHYSNTDNIIVALMAQAATGQRYEALLRRLVYRPLGMPRTSLPSGALLPRPFMHGYNYDPGFPPEDVSELLSASGSWASGGIVTTPLDLNTFIRAYAGQALLEKGVRSEQRQFFRGGGSEPPGPGDNSAGLALFRYSTSCGIVLGHTGNTPGYTQFAAATPDGSRSATVSINLQLTPRSGPPGMYPTLRRIYKLAACAALAR